MLTFNELVQSFNDNDIPYSVSYYSILDEHYTVCKMVIVYDTLRFLFGKDNELTRVVIQNEKELEEDYSQDEYSSNPATT